MMEGPGSGSVPLTNGNGSGTLLQGVKIIVGYFLLIYDRYCTGTSYLQYFLRTAGVVSELSILALTYK
jgi:hypothetical protein